jgi:pimeloyl-ACP methyl ester carboxylesterase
METQTTQAPPLEIRNLAANGFTFRCRVCGLDNPGEAVILLHGFPETSHLWKGMMQFLATQGYRCLAPDQRGYSPEARPKAVSAYRITEIAADIMALADSMGFDRVHLVGHDWGAGCGWTVVERYGDRILSWSALSIPHMTAFRTAKAEDPEQRRRSWYIDFFQKPLIPEVLFGLITTFRPQGLWNFSTADEIADYLNVFGKFAGRRAALNWYRANSDFPGQDAEVTVASILIWGNQDAAIARSGVEGTQQYMKGPYELIELEAGHALVQEQFDRVKQAIFQHIQRHGSR